MRGGDTSPNIKLFGVGGIHRPTVICNLWAMYLPHPTGKQGASDGEACFPAVGAWVHTADWYKIYTVPIVSPAVSETAMPRIQFKNLILIENVKIGWGLAVFTPSTLSHHHPRYTTTRPTSTIPNPPYH